ncbi:hypothetical protein K438DRAFT_1853638 [Mycena galopus ATCC 62051]|nr:hypothetical protein K438DRAFT_1853638 [Mycena galopus ATCC 62051]
MEPFSKSPTFCLLVIIKAAISRNKYLFLPRGSQPSPRDAFARMLVIHLRRGDYIVHCLNLVSWNSTYYSWAQLPNLPNQFSPLPDDDPEYREDARALATHHRADPAQDLRHAGRLLRQCGLGAFPRRALPADEQAGSVARRTQGQALKVAGWRTLVTTLDLRNKRTCRSPGELRPLCASCFPPFFV